MLVASPLQAQDAGGKVEGETVSQSPPNGVIVYSSLGKRGWDLYSHDVDGDSKQVTTHTSLDYNAKFSPDGSKIAFVSERDGNVEIYTSNADGSNIVRLTNDVAMDDHPSWSPDGRRLAFSSTRQPNEPGRAWNGIYVMNADGSDIKRVSGDGMTDYSPAWSPSGKQIAFASGTGQPDRTDLYVMDVSGKNRRQIVERGGWPTWIDGGKAIAFHRQIERGQWSIMRVDLDGSNERVAGRECIDAGGNA